MTTPDPIIVLSADGDSALSSKLCDASLETRQLVDYKQRLLFATSMQPVFENLGMAARIDLDMDMQLHTAPHGAVATYVPDEASESLSWMLRRAVYYGIRITPMNELMVAARTSGTLSS